MDDPLTAFHRDGYAGPFSLRRTDLVAPLRTSLPQMIAEGCALTGHGGYARHLDVRHVFDLCADPSVLGVLECLLGPDILLWNSGFWSQSKGQSPTPWHQDLLYWPTAFTLTCWTALTDADARTGCLLVAPGSHHSIVPHTSLGPTEPFEIAAADDATDSLPTRALAMSAGQFVILSDRVLHASTANTSDTERIALVSRYTLPSIKILDGVLPLSANHWAIQVRGEDRFAINRLGHPPAGSLLHHDS